MSLEPTWQSLPKIITDEVIKRLDFKSRCSLRACSRRDFNLINDAPMEFDNITLLTSFSDGTYSIRIEHFRQFYYILKDESDQGQAVKVFLNLLRNRNSKTKCITFQLNSGKEIIHRFIEEVKSSLTIKSGIIAGSGKGQFCNKLTINTEKFTWNCEEPKSHGELLEMLKLFDTRFLKTFTVRNSNCYRKYDCFFSEQISSKVHNEVPYSHFLNFSKTEQWKNLSKVELHCKIDSHLLSHFLHLDKFRVDVKDWTPSVIWDVIQSFRIRILPCQSYFKIYNNLEPVPINEMLQQFDVYPSHQPLGFITREVHTQRFPTVSENHTLIVLFEARKIRGIICRKGFVKEDCSGANEFVM